MLMNDISVIINYFISIEKNIANNTSTQEISREIQKLEECKH